VPRASRRSGSQRVTELVNRIGAFEDSVKQQPKFVKRRYYSARDHSLTAFAIAGEASQVASLEAVGLSTTGPTRTQFETLRRYVTKYPTTHEVDGKQVEWRFSSVDALPGKNWSQWIRVDDDADAAAVDTALAELAELKREWCTNLAEQQAATVGRVVGNAVDVMAAGGAAEGLAADVAALTNVLTRAVADRDLAEIRRQLRIIIDAVAPTGGAGGVVAAP